MTKGLENGWQVGEASSDFDVRRAFAHGEYMGALREQERIIKLLEGYQAKKCNDYECFSGLNRNAHDWECGVDEMNRNIALIKGEK